MAEQTIDFIGKEHIKNIDNCITRVRLTVDDNKAYDDQIAVKIGYTGVVKVGSQAYQMIIGAESEIIANEMRRLLSEGYGNDKPTAVKDSTKKPEVKTTTKTSSTKTKTTGKTTAKTKDAKKPQAKTAAKKPVAKSTAKKPVAKKPAAKKPVAKTITTKKPAAKKPAAKKPVAKKK